MPAGAEIDGTDLGRNQRILLGFCAISGGTRHTTIHLCMSIVPQVAGYFYCDELAQEPSAQKLRDNLEALSLIVQRD